MTGGYVCASLGAELLLVDRHATEPLAQQPASAPHRAKALVCDVTGRAEVARIAAANGPVDALVLVGDLPLDDWRELASDEVIALNLHGPIHFARAYLPAGHDGVAHGARALARKAHRRAHRQPAASPRRSAPGPCARPNWPFQIGDGRAVTQEIAATLG
jgi:NAD(P)-dependent dehydrogenase (short-subunit alcohol dehydrogenase family)